MVTYKRLGTNGELGNQLFQIAATIGYAEKIKSDFIFPRWVNNYTQENYSLYFRGDIPQSNNLSNDFIIFTESSFCYNDIPADIGNNVDLLGYFQSAKYFDNVSKNIKELFKPSQNILDKITKLNYNNTVCVQLRFYDNSRPYQTRGLNLDASVSLYHTPISNIEFFKKAINYFGKHKTFLVTTNNVIKAKEMFGKYNNFNFLEDYNYIEQFFIQTLSENNIISNSSFGWWGAYLNEKIDKKVFAPKNWFTVNDDYYNTKDLYLPDWNVI